MLTRLRVSGFKNLVDVDVELGPYTCIAGPNGVGKSNLFDAITFLAALADDTIMGAAQRVRGESRRAADVRDLFWDRGPDWRDERDPRISRKMEFEAEMIVPFAVVDDFGRKADASITFLRYELHLGYAAPDASARFGQIRLLHEQLRHITLSDAAHHLRFPHSAKAFRNAVVRGRRTAEWLISTTHTTEEHGRDEVVIRVHQDGGSRGNPKPSSAEGAQRTIVGTTTTSADPTILACRREMQSWRRLALEPGAMREPSEWTDPPRLGVDGSNLAATLYRLGHPARPPENAPAAGDGHRSLDAPATSPELEADYAEGVYARVAARLSQLIGVRRLSVERDERRELLSIMASEGGMPVAARALSDGTLRFLALCVLQADPDSGGLLCMEEPENGIHPRRLAAMSELIVSLAVDPNRAPGPDNPFRQVIVNSHSPGFVALQRDDDLLLADTVRVRRGPGEVGRKLSLSPVAGSWRTVGRAAGIPRAVVRHLLSDPTTQLPLVEGSDG